MVEEKQENMTEEKDKIKLEKDSVRSVGSNFNRRSDLEKSNEKQTKDAQDFAKLSPTVKKTTEQKVKADVVDNKPEKKPDEKSKEQKPKKKEEKKIIKKEEAAAKGQNLRCSKKHCSYICSFIQGKNIDVAIAELEQVIRYKKAVPFKGEVPHRKGKGMMSGRYPIKAAGLFINVLKSLKGNVVVNGMDLDRTVIYHSSASWGARPMRSNRRQGKRTNVVLKAKEVVGGKRI